jgi:hypothetical protein
LTNRAHVLLWTDQPAAYLDAVKEAGLADRVAIQTLARREKPSAEQLAHAEALMAGGVPPGLLPSMPKLRWAQAMSAGVEGWLALPDLPAGLTLTCARGTHTESMPENIIGALFHVAKPYGAAHGGFPHFLQSHRQSAAEPARAFDRPAGGHKGRNNQAPKRGVRHFDHQQSREGQRDAHNRKERQKRRPEKSPTRQGCCHRSPAVLVVLRLRVNLVGSSAFSCPYFGLFVRNEINPE